ncbi:sensor domain-containing protein [Hydrocarboniphaga sp.]|uniref:sensor domain-containing protein n=1 Tax=Hydrocarboniphaga sp. TaxID=2033016 RepID=UPI003D099A5A
MRLVFPYLAQAHQVLHSLPIAAAIAQRDPQAQVHVAAVSAAQLDFACRLIERHAPQARIAFDLLPLGPGDAARLVLGWGKTHFKQYTLLRNRGYFNGFDAVVTPERTSLFLRRIGIKAALIWTRHGAGDREIGFAEDVREFDFVLMAGRKIEQRLLAAGLIRPGAYRSGVYAKFDWAQRAVGERLFDNDRPTVLYNPHFRAALSSWPRWGRAVLDAFAASTRYNLIFAPHVRLFDPPRAADYAALAPYQGLPHVHVDLGSERSIDMSYTQAADLYLGDVSSQVAEFLSRPRPCVFLDAHDTPWQHDPNYRFWALGPVLNSVARLEDELDRAFEQQRAQVVAQQRYVADTFELEPGPSAPRGAEAIIQFLRAGRGAGRIA